MSNLLLAVVAIGAFVLAAAVAALVFARHRRGPQDGMEADYDDAPRPPSAR